MNKQMIINLVLKDFRVYRMLMIFASLGILAGGMLSTFVNTNTVAIFTTSFGNMVVCVIIAVFTLEQKNKMVRAHTTSLPVTRNATVIARYISTLIISLANLLLWVIVFNVLQNALKSEPIYLVDPKVILFTFMYLIFQLSLYLFVFYRFNIIITMIIYFIPILSWTALSSKGEFMINIMMNDTYSLVVFCLTSLALFIASYVVNLAYFRKKEL